VFREQDITRSSIIGRWERYARRPSSFLWTTSVINVNSRSWPCAAEPSTARICRRCMCGKGQSSTTSWGIGQIPGLRVAALTCNNMPSPHLRAWQNLLEAPSRTKMVKHLVRITTCVCTFQLASITKSLCKDSFELYTMLQIISQ
jgi:hypothetical protein